MIGTEKLEALVSKWLKPVPHLPRDVQKWIAVNSWWIMLVGVILSGLGLLIGLMGFFTALAIVGTGVGYYGYATANVYGGAWIVNTVISLIFMVGLVTLLATAILPLKAMKAKGWKILFFVLLIDAVYTVINAVFSFSVIGFVFSLIFGAIGLGISAYFLFEMKSHFIKS
jgi:hypothetical protein